MTNRHPALDRLLGSLEAAFLQRQPESPLKEEALHAFASLCEHHPPSGAAPSSIDACRHLDVALANARERGSAEIVAAAAALAELAPLLAWGRRAGSESEPVSFHNGHSNAIVIGPKGLEERTDCWLGITLMAPEVNYPVHRHPPEELYVVLSDGDWFQEGDGWFTPGIGGTVYNPGGSVHSMRSGPEPLLSFWLLWGGRSISL